jgi:hypothetical protein
MTAKERLQEQIRSGEKERAAKALPCLDIRLNATPAAGPAVIRAYPSDSRLMVLA